MAERPRDRRDDQPADEDDFGLGAVVLDGDLDGDLDGGLDDELDGDDFDEGDEGDADESESHRGAFGEFGGESGGLIERTFRERIVLVGVTFPSGDEEETEQLLDELALLVDTAGADVVGRIVQRRGSPDKATYIGKGKVDEVKALSEQFDADTVVFDDELSPAQQYNLEKILGRTAIDRTAVILDIFAQNAHSLEGKAQVELAMLRYRLPRLRSRGANFAQQSGRIGTRQGGGETKLEVDRRRILRRIHRLESELQEIGHNRGVQRKAQKKSRLKTVAIVGYTNAGKSTLLNHLTDAGVLVEDRLFATLDATTRRLELPGGEGVLLTDTVGFITKLPHGLVKAFKSTLEVVAEADLLVHVVDAAAPDPLGQIGAVRDVLHEIGADTVPEILAFNKADLDPDEAKRLAHGHAGSVSLSAATGEGVDDLLSTIGDRLRVRNMVVELLVPFARGDVLASIHREGEVLDEQAGEQGMQVRARLEPASAHRLREWLVAPATT